MFTLRELFFDGPMKIDALTSWSVLPREGSPTGVTCDPRPVVLSSPSISAVRVSTEEQEIMTTTAIRSAVLVTVCPFVVDGSEKR
jgi:hypothetical protein